MEERNKKGFTLLEILLVVAIITIIAVIAVPSYMASLAKAQDAANEANMRAARAVASVAFLTRDHAELDFPVKDKYWFNNVEGVFAAFTSLDPSFEPYGQGTEAGKAIKIKVTNPSKGVFSLNWEDW